MKCFGYWNFNFDIICNLSIAIWDFRGVSLKVNSFYLRQLVLTLTDSCILQSSLQLKELGIFESAPAGWGCIGDLMNYRMDKLVRTQKGVKRSISSQAATGAAIGSILLWCWTGVCYTQGSKLMGPMVYMTFITGVGTLTITFHKLFRRQPLLELVQLPPKVIVTGFWGVSVYTILLALAFGSAAPREIGQVNLLNYLWPIWIVLLSSVVLDENLRFLPTFSGALLGFGGVVISRGTEDFFHVPSQPTPHLMAMIGGFLWAIYCVLLRRWHIPEEKGGTALNFAMCSLMAAALAGYRGEWSTFPRLTPEILIWILFGGVGPVGLAYHWWEIGMKRGAVGLISLLAYFIPIGSSLLIGLFFRESMNPGLIPGAVLITAGAWIVQRATKETP